MTTYVLVPGAGGSAWYWHRVERELQSRGHVVLSVELPAEDTRKGLADYAAAVVRAAEGLGDVVLVGQSMGALTVPLAVDRLPVLALVLLNPMVPLPGETGGEWWAATGQEDAQLPGELFVHDLSPELQAEAARHDKGQAMTPFEQPWPLDAWPEVPTAVIAGVDDRLFPIDFQRRVVQERLGLPVLEVPGGHLAALSQPEAVALALETCVDELVLGG